ncbi:MAG: hypothetical protein V4612_03515 [Pseudomonadota bacterium]
MLLSLSRITKTILLIASLHFFCSCTKSKSDQANNNFLKQYGDHIEDINSRRDEMNISNQSRSLNRNWKEPKEIFHIENAESSKSAFIDTSQILMPKPPEDFLPNAETLLQGQSAQLPEDMFAVSYNLENFPNSYGRPRLSFDDITIPNRDAFGIETALGEKNYQLINHRTLQRDLDFTRQSASWQDREISAELIQEEKQLKRKKYLDKKIDQAAQKKDNKIINPQNF